MTGNKLTRAQQEALKLLHAGGFLTYPDLAKAIYKRRNPFGIAWSMLRDNQRRPRLRAAQKHLETLQKLGYVKLANPMSVRYKSVEL